MEVRVRAASATPAASPTAAATTHGAPLGGVVGLEEAASRGEASENPRVAA